MPTSSIIPVILVILTVSVSSRGKDASPPSSSLAVLYNSRGSDGPFQMDLLKGVILGLRDAEADSPLLQRPLFLDLSEVSRDWIFQNGTQQTLISLLTPNELKSFCDFISASNKLSKPVEIFTPRDLPDPDLSEFIKIKSLQMSTEGRIMALLHRIMKVGTETLLPVLDDEDQLPLLRKYQSVSSRMFPGLQFLSPVLLSQTPSWTSHPSFSIRKNGNGTVAGLGQGILLLSSQRINPDIQNKQVERDHFFQWFSHEGLHEWGQASRARDMFGLYSVQFVGARNWDNSRRRRLLKEFTSFTGPSPTVLSVVLAYDAARLAVTQHLIGSLPSCSVSGLSGDISFNDHGARSSGVYFGIFTLPKTKASIGTVLQPSDWMLEDLIDLEEADSGVVSYGEYRQATSSVISRRDLLRLGKRGSSIRRCGRVEMEVLTHDPFNQMEYRFTFDQRTLPEHLLIPNEFGYGLEFRCRSKDSESITTLEIACTPSRTSSTQEPVHCFKSGLSTRSKRSPKSSSPPLRAIGPRYSSRYSRVSNYSPREDNSMTNYQPPMNSYYNGYIGNNELDSSTPATMTTRLDVPINEDPTPPPGTGGGSKLPELRQILKAAKPFVGSCIGSSAGCAVCVLVLGRLPLGAVPAACTGPCFVGTFGTCGSLLGRVFSETTVICTELFRQGLLDVDTFLADAEFGRRMAIDSPETLLGYQIMATPLVERMKGSEGLTKVVAFLALPWTKHMKYLIGQSEEFNWGGYLVHTLGCGWCSFLGNILTCLDVSRTVESLGYSFGGLLIGLILIAKQFKINNGKRK